MHGARPDASNQAAKMNRLAGQSHIPSGGCIYPPGLAMTASLSLMRRPGQRPPRAARGVGER
jgi:hypothetical protein